MRRKRSRDATARAPDDKSAQREIKRGHRFIQHQDKDVPGTGLWYEDLSTGKSYPGEMPLVLRAYRLPK